jgi:hypothetical protein
MNGYIFSFFHHNCVYTPLYPWQYISHYFNNKKYLTYRPTWKLPYIIYRDFVIWCCHATESFLELPVRFPSVGNVINEDRVYSGHKNKCVLSHISRAWRRKLTRITHRAFRRLYIVFIWLICLPLLAITEQRTFHIKEFHTLYILRVIKSENEVGRKWRQIISYKILVGK